MRRAAFIMAATLLLVGCRATRDLNTSENERGAVERLVYIHDSIFTERSHNVYINGDTVRITDTFYLARWHTAHDTVHDTCWRDRKVKEYTEREVKKYPLLPYEIGVAVVALLVWLLRLYLRRK